jgi:hypothetical protein
MFCQPRDVEAALRVDYAMLNARSALGQEREPQVWLDECLLSAPGDHLPDCR